MKTGYFITGTDTNIGKTWATIALMRRYRQSGLVVAGMKPVAAGCQLVNGKLINEDAKLLQENTGWQVEYDSVNPYAFEMPFSPHFACGEVDVSLELILTEFSKLKRQADVLLVEGAGGWLSPLGRNLDNAALAKALGLPVIVVVGMRLGCINHARLTFQAISQAGVSCGGWVAVEIVPRSHDFDANLNYLRNCADARLLGVLPHLPEADFDLLAGHFFI